MFDVRTSHTSDLDAITLQAARDLLYRAFDDNMTDEDWEHSLGGVHALVWDGAELIGHGSVVQRRLLHTGRALRTGYIEGVVVRADQRRRGCGAAVMDALERVVRGAYELGALSTTEVAVRLYEARGWSQWRGPSFALTPSGIRRTEDDDGGIYVLPVTAVLDLDGEITCDWRNGDVW